MDETRDILEHAHNLIAGKLLWDSNFINSLHENPRDAITEALLKGGLDPAKEDLLQILESEYYEHKDEVLELAHGWYSSGEIKPMVA